MAALYVTICLPAPPLVYITDKTCNQLLKFGIASLVFIGIRVIYSLVALCTQNLQISPISGSLATRVILSFLPELIGALLLIFAGILTRNVRRIATAAEIEGQRENEQYTRKSRK